MENSMKQPRIAVTFVQSTGEVIMGRKKRKKELQFLNSQSKKYGKNKNPTTKNKTGTDFEKKKY